MADLTNFEDLNEPTFDAGGGWTVSVKGIPVLLLTEDLKIRHILDEDGLVDDATTFETKTRAYAISVSYYAKYGIDYPHKFTIPDKERAEPQIMEFV